MPNSDFGCRIKSTAGRSKASVVYDEAVAAKRPVVFLQPDSGKACARTPLAKRAAWPARIMSCSMADMFGVGYGAKRKTVDELRAGMLAVHKNLPFTLACGSKAYDALSAKRKSWRCRHREGVAAGYCAGGGYVLEQARAGRRNPRNLMVL